LFDDDFFQSANKITQDQVAQPCNNWIANDKMVKSQVGFSRATKCSKAPESIESYDIAGHEYIRSIEFILA